MTATTEASNTGHYRGRTQRPVHPPDAAELRWYFGGGGAGLFRMSTFGSQLEKARLFSDAKRCPTCRGSGFVAIPPSLPKLSKKKAKKWAQGSYKRRLPPGADSLCQDCGGVGWVPRKQRARRRRPLTARPTGSSKTPGMPGLEIDEVALSRLGAVARRLSKIRVAHPELIAILDAVYGEDGGLLTLYPATSAGRKLLKDNGQKLHPLKLLENILSTQQKWPDPRRRELLEQAHLEALALHRAAVDAWIDTAFEDSGARALRLLNGGAL